MVVSDCCALLKMMVVGILYYVTTVGLRRITIKRTLSEINALYLVVTAALGSTLPTVLLLKMPPFHRKFLPCAGDGRAIRSRLGFNPLARFAKLQRHS